MVRVAPGPRPGLEELVALVSYIGGFLTTSGEFASVWKQDNNDDDGPCNDDDSYNDNGGLKDNDV